MSHPVASFPLALVAPLLLGGLAAQSWQQVLPASAPSAREGHAMATDLGSGKVVMFGGSSGAAYLGDTWLFDGASWTALVGLAPPARTRSAMAFDEARGVFVMYGGINGVGISNWLAGTWELANGVWSQRPNGGIPPRRFGHAMAYDVVRGRVVMFGGRTNAGTIFTQDTWEWDGTSWTPFLPAHMPNNRMSHAMAFDPNLGKVVLFGGLQIGGPYRNDTWAWDGTDWMQLAPANAPTPRGDHAMATDRARGRIVLRGGYNGTDLLDTWEWDGATWSAVSSPAQPGVLALAAMATGPTGRHVVLFGGDDLAGATQVTWRYGDQAQATSFGSGCGVPPLTLAAAAGTQPALGQTFVSEVTAVPAGGLPFLSLGMSNTFAGAVPLPLDLSFLGMTGCTLYHDLTLLGLGCTWTGSAWQSSLALPNQPTLAGIDLYSQAYALAPGSNPLGLTTSNAQDLYLGLP